MSSLNALLLQSAYSILALVIAFRFSYRATVPRTGAMLTKDELANVEEEITREAVYWRYVVKWTSVVALAALACSGTLVLAIGKEGLARSTTAQVFLLVSSLSGTTLVAMMGRLGYLQVTTYKGLSIDPPWAKGIREAALERAAHTWLAVTLYRVLIIDQSLFRVSDYVRTTMPHVVSGFLALAWSAIIANVGAWIVYGIAGNATYRAFTALFRRHRVSELDSAPAGRHQTRNPRHPGKRK